MPTVYVLKEQIRRNEKGEIIAMDYSPAMEFGDVVFVSETEMPDYTGINSAITHQWFADMRKFADAYNPDYDYIVASGRPDSIFIAGYLLAKTGKTPRFLVWRKTESRYRVVLVSL